MSPRGASSRWIGTRRCPPSRRRKRPACRSPGSASPACPSSRPDTGAFVVARDGVAWPREYKAPVAGLSPAGRSAAGAQVMLLSRLVKIRLPRDRLELITGLIMLGIAAALLGWSVPRLTQVFLFEAQVVPTTHISAGSDCEFRQKNRI